MPRQQNLSGEDEEVIIVSTLKSVINGEREEQPIILPVLKSCQVCNADCLGCDLFPATEGENSNYNNTHGNHDENQNKKNKNKKIPYRGVSRTSSGKWATAIWDPWKKKNVWLGSFREEEAAAREYDRKNISFRGKKAMLNFRLSDYEREIEMHGNQNQGIKIDVSAGEGTSSVRDRDLH